MTYLLAKFTLLFLAATLLGFVLGYWFSRRKFVDVSESFEDLRTANARSDASQWEKLWKRLDAMPAPKEPDFTNVNERIAGVASAVAGLPRPEPVSFDSVETRLDSLQEIVRNIPTPITPRYPDLQPIEQRLTTIESKLNGLGTHLVQSAPVEQAPRKLSRDEPRILSAALYGTKDDLKQISGVGPKLEKVLNKNGVYYFWQVAEWNAEDIDLIDERLDTFKGRIARDNWVSQAKQLRHTDGAASRPAE